MAGIQHIEAGTRLLRVKHSRHPWLHLVAIALSALVALPILSLAFVALSGGGEDWPHLVANVLPGASRTTLLLLALVAAATSVIGVLGAWLVVAFDFPLRRVFSWALVLPLAVPPYLAAYAFGEFFHYSGPLQTLIRAMFGFATIRDYWFPDIRSTPGAAFVLSSVLYPYVYLTTRIVFLMQGRNIADVARTLGARPAKVFWKVLLPVARPAIVAGVALVLMETINDIGASEYLGVRTLTFSVYTTWLARGSLEGGAQIALLMLVLVFLLLGAEHWARRKQRFNTGRATHMRAYPPRTRLSGLAGLGAVTAVALPVLIGFGIPLLVFGQYASRRLDQFLSPALADAFLNSLVTATATATITILLALFLINAVRLSRSRTTTVAVRFAAIGYALPGGVLGLGLLFVLAHFDNALDAFMRLHFGLSTGLLLTGSAGAVVLACTIRFLALAEGAIHSGMEKLPRHLDEAARSLGQTPSRSAARVLLPLLKPAIFTAAVLVFVDTIKELSATILLRPFGFNTLATYVYENASRGVPEEGAVAAIVIILTAMVPVVLLSGALIRDREAVL
ncbi:iron(III) transport system permease protein [Mesorhizobium albiziae]|uniref:Iron(III) transport system permease protein n=1 Tax=Neomesorhizobium albiziae TaxID=335020 RepID=A0A1I4B6I0_9HYPH|nr:iron ABC transporter permease [Mesorhizobium albiziae]GLS34319.1 iron ABC transporter permease [Mesorhizobium albiziae]SFK63611.1 iron(III) transport system permease protein [Mesorhizobium albiziae]